MDGDYIPVLSAEQMKLCDSYTIEKLSVPSQTLMERAAERAADVLLSDSRFDTRRVLVLAGGGNNGGDGIAMARLLHGKGIYTSVCFVGAVTSDGLPASNKTSVECIRQYRLAVSEGVEFILKADLFASIDSYTCIVDAIFGIGLSRDIEGEIFDIIQLVNGCNKPILSVDVPSGIDADDGRICGISVRADVTVCIQALKSGLLLFPTASFAGDIRVCDIGIDLSPVCQKEYMRMLCKERLPEFFRRGRRSNKGSFGRVLFICGSCGMSGAAYLSASAALRCGIGLAHVFTHGDNRVIIQSQLPEAIVSTYADVASAKLTLNQPLASADLAVVGCGLGRSATAYTLLEHVLNFEKKNPLVLDADALNIIAQNPQLWLTKRFTDGGRHITVITPHPAEFARLTGASVREILRDMPYHARKFAKEHGVFVVLKDAHTVIASPNEECYINPHGNSGMAKGGSGDMLAGIIGAMLADIASGTDASDSDIARRISAAVLLHSLAGEAARAELGEVSMLPTDVISAISRVTKDFCDTTTKIEFI
ncbi:MAG: NAD(P)H-hydrate dehydratase [Ruminococcaceae bacterium]|nr:NAD(P)H-hydrate dehydratase [Oscillospiraceae bacterium]